MRRVRRRVHARRGRPVPAGGATGEHVIEYSVMDLTQVDWGLAPDWFAGAGALAALVFAILAVRAAHSTNVQQGIELEAMQDDRRQQQVIKIAAWMIDPVAGGRIIRLRNGSDLPVFGVMLFRGLGNESTWFLATLRRRPGPEYGRRHRHQRPISKLGGIKPMIRPS